MNASVLSAHAQAATGTFDKRQLRNVLGSFVTGVTVVTTLDTEGKMHGLTANSFSSVSLDPPLVLWSQATSAGSHAAFRDSDRFTINILAEDQHGLANHFAARSPDKFSGIDYDIGIDGLPVLRDCSAWLECKVVSRHPGGDHVIFVGSVERIRQTTRRPLVFGGGQYLVADPHDLGHAPVGTQGAMKSQPHAVRLANRSMLRLANALDKTLALVAWGNHGPTVIAWQAGATPVAADLPLGLVLPVTSSASGLALAAFLPPEAIDRFVTAELRENRRRESDDLPLTAQSLYDMLESVRASRVATRRPGPFHDDRVLANAISVPILSPDGTAVLALTAIGPAGQFDAATNGPCAQALKAAAEEISAALQECIH
ncbi:flavin reductase [Paraburkholderia silviterrae]|uniref:Flavin reductase n=1 Tax=Paraburkholderia silviterrae TaxID=2528715 RepID=A0A4R5M0Q4_9BURK|nr:flavin reductase [Paraburkholderia silviterrae]TDG18784.1 flavin reductase [Paraburkholderia silviterrae]